MILVLRNNTVDCLLHIDSYCLSNFFLLILKLLQLKSFSQFIYVKTKKMHKPVY